MNAIAAENENAEGMGQPLEKEKQIAKENKANLKKFTKAELLEAKRSLHISYEFYCLVKAELERRKHAKRT
jgi:hypothetical protein